MPRRASTKREKKKESNELSNAEEKEKSPGPSVSPKNNHMKRSKTMDFQPKHDTKNSESPTNAVTLPPVLNVTSSTKLMRMASGHSWKDIDSIDTSPISINSSPNSPIASPPSKTRLSTNPKNKLKSPSGTLPPSARSDVSQEQSQKSALELFEEEEANKLQEFSLNDLVTRGGQILHRSLDDLLETTSIRAVDKETGLTLLEYSCQKGDVGLAKYCFRKGTDLNEPTLSGLPFNIAIEHKRYEVMEFLHRYGVKVNACDKEGRTGLHVATSKNDLDAICRLIEWSADVNLRDKRKRTALHYAAIGGHEKVSMLLLELGADINAKDEKEFTAVAHAEVNDKYKLMDKLVYLGGEGHGLLKNSAPSYLRMNPPKSLKKGAGVTPRNGPIKRWTPRFRGPAQTNTATTSPR